MAFVLTYNSLVATVENYLERLNNAFVDDIPLFIMLGERRVARDLKILGLKVFITANFIVGEETLAKPTRWLNSSTFNMGTNVGTSTGFNTRVQIEQRSYEYARIYWPNPTQTAQPKYYADYDYNHWLISPTPDQAYPYEIAYYETPALIDEDESTNFLTTNCPDVLIYATLLETASYLKDDERVPIWTQYYNVAKSALTEEDMRRVYDGFSVRGG